MVSLPSPDPGDPAYRRLRYIRYADDHLLGFTGPKAEAEQIKQRLTQFLRDELKLELSQEKTLITHARTGAARFLGYEITTQHNDTKKTAQTRNPEPGTRNPEPDKQSGQGDLPDPSPKCGTALSRV
nr:reverse transcriptase domain-containing protein [Streptomyces sp. NBRC 109436]